MACSIIQTWTFVKLVGAFLDLAVAFLLLCGSTAAFFAAKFLGILGLNLPCSCNGLFGDPNSSCSSKCLQRLLVEYPAKKISSVQMSVLSNSPFDSIWMKENGCQFKVKLVRDKSCEELLEMASIDQQKQEESSSSFSEAKKSRNLMMSKSQPKNDGFEIKDSSGRESNFDFKGKGTLNQKPRSGFRRRRRDVFQNGKYLSVSSSDHLRLIRKGSSSSLPSRSENGEENSEGSSAIGNSHGILPQYNAENELNGPLSGWKVAEKDVEELMGFGCEEQSNDINDANTIRILEQALEEEQAARNVLYLELEKERSAAASAADEAMAMILRLQKEKAVIEMESRQYQRIIEERSAYDEEEMNILKEILLRREREKHVLEKEVEVYRQMLSCGATEPSEEDPWAHVEEVSGQVPISLSDLSGDPILVLQQISESIKKKEMVGDTNKFSGAHKGPSVQKQSGSSFLERESPPLCRAQDENCNDSVDVSGSYASWRPASSSPNNFFNQTEVQSVRGASIDKEDPHVPGYADENKLEFQENGMVSMDEYSSVSQGQPSKLEDDSISCQLDMPKEQNLHEKTFILVDKEHKHRDNSRICHENAEKDDGTCRKTEYKFPYNNMDWENHDSDVGCSVKDSLICQFESELSVHDVHVIDDKLCNMNSGKQCETALLESASGSSKNGGLPFETSRVLETDVLSDDSSMCKVGSGPSIHRSISDMTRGLPPLPDGSRGKTSCFYLRRNSIQAVDKERLKLDMEVRWLMERLKMVQEGRGKLNVSMEHRERETFQLQLLEEIACQLREIRQLTEPRKAVRQASLPPTSSKVGSKKRRCRSMTWGIESS